MRNNDSAIISILDVGIVYTKFGSVTDDIFIKGGNMGRLLILENIARVNTIYF